MRVVAYEILELQEAGRLTTAVEVQTVTFRVML